MVMAPLFALAGFIVHPAVHTNESAQLSVVSAHMDRWYLANLLLFVSVVLAVPAALGLMHMLREREVAFGHVGGGLALMGLMAIAGLAGIGMVTWQMGADPNVSGRQIFNGKGLSVATVTADDKVLFKTVTIARDLGKEIELASGVAPDDRVIVAPPDGIADGDQVRVVGAGAKGKPATASEKQDVKG